MAIYHMSASTLSRGRGQSATAAAAYRRGSQIVDRTTGELHDYTRKQGVEYAEVVLPDGAPDWASDPEALWCAAEGAETRRNATIAREYRVALPAELDADERRELALEYARHLVDSHGCAADVAIHQPDQGGDQRNHHAHILTTTRRMEPGGLAAKTRELDDRSTGRQWITSHRETWATMANRALEQAQSPERIDHRTLAEQGIDREPTQHLGPAASAAERERPGSTRIGRANRARIWQGEAREQEREQLERDIEVLEHDAQELEREETALEDQTWWDRIRERMREIRQILRPTPAPEPESPPAPAAEETSTATTNLGAGELAARIKAQQAQQTPEPTAEEREQARQQLMADHGEPIILDEVRQDEQGQWQWRPIPADQLTHEQQCAIEDARDELAAMQQQGPELH